jgi:hypothetical protein
VGVVRAALALAVLTTTTVARADDAPAANVVLWQPLSLITSYIDVEYERALGTRASVYVAPGAIFRSGQRLDGSTDVALFAWSVDLGGRWFPWGRAPSGFFVDLGVGYFSSSFLGARTLGDGVRGLSLAGYTLILARHFVLSAGLGVSVQGFRPRATYYGQDDWSVAVNPALRVAVGVAF